MSIKNIKQKKIEYRCKYKKIRSSIDFQLKEKLDKKLSLNFLSCDEYKKAEVVFAFISKDIEVETKEIITQALADGKKVAVPRCNTEERLMDFYYINSFDDLVKGAYNLMEPDKEKCRLVTQYSSGVCIIPGLVFDRDGYRIGFGKGYYDRFLSSYKGVSIGVCYSRCLEVELPRGYFDRPVDIIVTEKYTIDTRNF